MIGLLIWLFVFLVVFMIAKAIVGQMELDPGTQKIVYLVLGLIALLLLVSQLGLLGGGVVVLR